MRRAIIALAVVIALVSPSAPASAWGGNPATNAIADKLRGTQRVGWLATTLDIGGYYGKRTAQIVKIPSGHGKRWVGIIVVPVGNGPEAAAALDGVWFTRTGRKIVVPLVNQYDTDGCAEDTCKTATRWAKRRLGERWTVYAPADR